MSEKKLLRKPIEAARQLGEVMRDYFYRMDRISRGEEEGRIAWCTSAGPAELLHAFGFEVHYPENHGAKHQRDGQWDSASHCGLDDLWHMPCAPAPLSSGARWETRCLSHPATANVTRFSGCGDTCPCRRQAAYEGRWSLAVLLRRRPYLLNTCLRRSWGSPYTVLPLMPLIV